MNAKPAILLLAFALASCRLAPSARLADGSTVTLGVSWLTKNKNQAAYAKVTSPGGQTIELRDMVSGEDETKAVDALTTYGIGKIAGETKQVINANDNAGKAYGVQAGHAANAQPTIVQPSQLAPGTTAYPLVVPANKIPSPPVFKSKP